jgi:hypothetical protein
MSADSTGALLAIAAASFAAGVATLAGIIAIAATRADNRRRARRRQIPRGAAFTLPDAATARRYER